MFSSKAYSKITLKQPSLRPKMSRS